MSHLHFASFGRDADVVGHATRGFSDIERYVTACWRAAAARVHHARWREIDDDGWLTFADDADDRDIAALVGGDKDEVVAVDGPADRAPEPVEVLERDEDSQRLRLRRRPTKKVLRKKANAAPLQRQREALRDLGTPLLSDRPLLRLCEPLLRARWPGVIHDDEPHWQVLNDGETDGAAEQRRFVRAALATPDFAVLEGPPGSGKTTAILELILQQARRGKRVLLCASTHVAVDNVLERLAPWVEKPESDVFPVRFGRESKVSEAVRRFRFDRVVDTERERIRRKLQSRWPRSAAQERLLSAVNDKGDTLAEAILDLANVVCGTTIGILELKAARGSFDMLILDEASKTTFQEFLVPALRAQRWVVVGDRRQLSPFVDQDDIAENLRANVNINGTDARAARTDVLCAGGHDPAAAIVATEDAATLRAYLALGAERRVVVACADDADADDGAELARADIVVGSRAALARHRDALPLDAATLRDVDDEVIRCRHRTWHNQPQVPPRWEQELAFRLADDFALRLSGDTRTHGRRQEEAGFLTAPEDRDGVERVRRVAFPSLLEVLERGFDSDAPVPTALSAGLPPDVFAERRVLLRYQRRMDTAIAALSKQHLYADADGAGGALLPARGVDDRDFGYHLRGCRRVIVNDGREKGNVNQSEVDAVVKHLREFVSWAKRNPRRDEQPWQIAALSFYSAQERALRRALARLGEVPDGIELEVCTVDRFQGHEADVVALSFVKNHATSFLQSRNRLNVALTRARHLRLTFAHPGVFRCDEPLLAGLGDELSVIGGVE